jgi:hypothetical protein
MQESKHGFASYGSDSQVRLLLWACGIHSVDVPSSIASAGMVKSAQFTFIGS